MKGFIRKLRFIPLMAVVLLTGFQAVGQALPVVTVRLANPQFECGSQTYCLDVQFQSNTAGQVLFGMNVRFFYDDTILELIGFSDFQGGYSAVNPNPPQITTGNAGSGPSLFNLVGPAEFVNGAIQLTNQQAAPIVISTTGWTKIFKICFHVDDAASLNLDRFCPTVIWDLEYNVANGGYNAGDDGVVITLVDPDPQIDSSPATENVVQHNWVYFEDTQEMPWGEPDQQVCVSTAGVDILTQPAGTTICEGNSTVLSVVVQGGSGSYAYQWQSSSAPGGPFNNITVNGNASTFNTGNLVVTRYYRVLVADLQSGCGTATSEVASVFVEDRKLAGTNGALELCEGDNTPKNLFGALGGTADPGGTWTDNDVTGVNLTNPNAVIFGALPTGVYHYTYTQPSTQFCAASAAIVTVTVTPYLFAGTDGSLTFFSGDPVPKNLFAALTGGAEMGGTWSDDDLTGVNLSNPLNVNFSMVPPGVYEFTYTQPQRGSCEGSSALVTVTIVPGTVDLGISKTVYNAVPAAGESTYFTVRVMNNSSSVIATNVEVTDLLDPGFLFQSYNSSQGTYVSGTGLWSVGTLNPGASATLVITVTVLESADNTAIITHSGQGDSNPANDVATVSVTVDGTSGGNDGGIESNGNLAGKIAIRNHERLKEGTRMAFISSSNLQNYTLKLAAEGVIKSVSVLKNQTNLISYLPETGPFKSKPFVSTPSDLIGISNAKEVIALDYFGADDKRYAAILALTTDHGEVYNHTKLICDRLMGARLEKEMNVTIQDKSFIMTKLVQENGEVDYAVSFIAWANGSGLSIDNRWNNEEYNPAEGSLIYNFQVWSVTVQSTIDLVNEVLARVESRNQVKYLNIKERSIPVVTVVTGEYRKGNLHLTMKNPQGANQVKIKGNFTRTELSDREQFEYTFSLDPGRQTQEIDVPIGLIFDAGFSVANNVDPVKDVLYFADGPWGLDYPDAGAVITGYSISSEPAKAGPDDLPLERNVTFSARVKDYASIFRTMRAGNRPINATAWNALEFEATGNIPVEVVITKRNMDNWSDQYRTRVYLQASEKTYTIEFEKLVSGISSKRFSADDVESVVFSAIGNGSSYTDVNVNLKNLRFTNRQTDPAILSLENYRLTNYPNPFTYQTFIEFELPEKGKVTLTVYDVAGREIERIVDREFSKGRNVVAWENNYTIRTGAYMLRMLYNGEQATHVMLMK